MGDMADWLMDMELGAELDFSDRDYENQQNKMWTTKDGRHIQISDMTDMHLANTICMIEEGRSNHDEDWIPILQTELNARY